MKKKGNYWILPCNSKKYNIDKIFQDKEEIEWHQTNTNVEPGDIVYIYLTSPKQEVKYKCQVVFSNKISNDINDKEYCEDIDFSNYGKYMVLKKIKSYTTPKTFHELQEKGFKGIVRCIRYLDQNIVDFIEEEVNN